MLFNPATLKEKQVGYFVLPDSLRSSLIQIFKSSCRRNRSRRASRSWAQQITRDYAGLNPLLIGVLKGACFFLSDLLRAIDTRLGIEFMAISSYGSSTRTSGEVRIMKDLDVPIEGRHILVVEDIVDTGLTLSYLLANLASRGAASVKLAALLDKYERRQKEVKIDYLGFQIPDEFVVGYGLDFAERYRNLPFIAVLKNPEA